MAGRKSKTKRGKGRPWRENIEAITVSVIVIVLFKYFILEAYKIPTGSMQPTLMGWDDGKGGGVFDRVIVDKLSYRFRDPERWEIAVFRYPLDSSKNFIKRIVGMPGEQLKIEDGDLFTRKGEDEDWAILRKPEKLQETQLKELALEGAWFAEEGDLAQDARELRLSGSGTVRFPKGNSAVLDRYADGYPGRLAEVVKGKPVGSSRFRVGDLVLRTTIEAEAACSQVRCSLLEGDWAYTLEIPGPATAAGSQAKLVVHHTLDPQRRRSVLLESVPTLDAGRGLAVELRNVDDHLSVRVDGESVHEEDLAAVPQREMIRSGVTLSTDGAGAVFGDIHVLRDIYYTDDQKVTSWEIPEDSYVVLGDNTQDSSDSRDWMLIGYELSDGEQVWGNQRTRENPMFRDGDPGGRQVFFRDQLGELHTFAQSSAKPLTPKPAGLVPRELIRGRAVMVVWPPYVPSYELTRLKWAR